MVAPPAGQRAGTLEFVADAASTSLLTNVIGAPLALFVGETYVIGRHTSCALRIKQDLRLSKRHCAVAVSETKTGEFAFVIENTSTNGVRLNSVVMRRGAEGRQPILHDDTFALEGKTPWRFVLRVAKRARAVRPKPKPKPKPKPRAAPRPAAERTTAPVRARAKRRRSRRVVSSDSECDDSGAGPGGAAAAPAQRRKRRRDARLAAGEDAAASGGRGRGVFGSAARAPSSVSVPATSREAAGRGAAGGAGGGDGGGDVGGGEAQRVTGVALVGRRVCMWWEGMGKWYTGDVCEYDARSVLISFARFLFFCLLIYSFVRRQRCVAPGRVRGQRGGALGRASRVALSALVARRHASLR